jgi:putative ATP-dependent endonuclease of OLD family
MVGEKHSIATALGFASTEPDRLFRQLQMLIDGGIRGVSEASLGSANILYLALKQLEHSNLLKNEERQHTILAIEEPEAHIHPHLQRLIYRTYLRTRSDAERKQDQCSIFLTTHSPNIASVAPLANIVLLHKDHKQNFTTGRSLSKLTLEVMESDDLERYIDVTRGEIFFSKGVILVEGDAEKFLISTLADLLDDPINLDAVGISVCSIGGTNFSPFIKLLGPKGLDIPFVVLTDLDPKEKDGSQEDEDMGSSTLDSYGKQRVVNQIMKHLLSPEEFGRGAEFALALAPEKGIFLNTFTFEIDLINTGIHNIFRDVAKELTTNKQIHRRFEGLIEKPESLVAKSLLKDIESIGKGRFAQRLSSHLHKSKTNACPPYIKMALEHLRKALT